ncbi:MAG: segregation/condensation protein A [Thermotogota bacterium]|nr:segregation/condensation protein A [Thermotogota bacterium]
MSEEKLVFTLPEFEGPLDLLLFLVRKHRVDVRQIPLSTIADEFVAHLEKMKFLELEVTSDFIIMASTLMQMKSKALLPRMNSEEEQEFSEQKQAFYQQVEEYKKIKDVSKKLRHRLYESYSRNHVKANTLDIEKEVEELPEQLTDAFKSIMKETFEKDRVYTVYAELFSVEERMNELEERFEISLITELKSLSGRLEIIVTFLAVLELVKLGKYTLVSLEPEPLFRRVEN